MRENAKSILNGSEKQNSGKNGKPKSLFATSIEGFNPKFDFTHSWTDHWNEDLLSVIGTVIDITENSVRTFENVCTQKSYKKTDGDSNI